MENKDYLSVAETAKLVRLSLKKRFPATKFSVRSDSYSGGASIDVSWTDGPTQKEVKQITGQFTGADFDGMIDLKTYNSSWLMPNGSAQVAKAQGTENSRGYIPAEDHPKPHPNARLVHFGADFIFCSRAHSVEAMKEAVREVCLMYGWELARVEADCRGAHIPWDCKEGNQTLNSGNGPQGAGDHWSLREQVSRYLEHEDPYPQEPKPGDPEYEALKAKLERLQKGCAA